MHMVRRSAIGATPWFLIVFFIIFVAKCSYAGMIDCTAFGMFHWMDLNQAGPIGIFIGIAGLPSGLTLSLRRSFLSSSSP